MTREELQQLSQLCEKATPGPWVWFKDDMYQEERLKAAHAWLQQEPLDWDQHVLAEPIIETDSGVYGPEEYDRQFIAAARTAIPRLLSLVAHLEVLLRDGDNSGDSRPTDDRDNLDKP